EDVLQRVFYEVWRNRDRYDPTRSLEAWVLGIARKRAIDLLRRRHANVVPIEELRDIAGDDGRDMAERYVRASEVRGALERLSPEQREVLALAYFGELTQTEIADRPRGPRGPGRGGPPRARRPPPPPARPRVPAPPPALRGGARLPVETPALPPLRLIHRGGHK